MLETHPQRNHITIVLLPLAKEVMHRYATIPLKIEELRAFCGRTIIAEFGFKNVDFSYLHGMDDLWYLRQLWLRKDYNKNKLISALSEEDDDDDDLNHAVQINKYYQSEDIRNADGESLCIEGYSDLFQRVKQLRLQLSRIVLETE